MAQRYYRPFLESDSELSDSDDESYFSGIEVKPFKRPPNSESESEEEIPDFAKFAKALTKPVVEASGPTFGTVKQEDAYINSNYSPFDLKDASGVKIQMTTKDITTVVVLQSRDRDKTIFPQPTNCTLFLPRIYRNVQKFSVSQINLISAFFYFRADKENLSIKIYEKDRVYYSTILAPPTSTTPLQIETFIRPGSYNIQSLLTELQLQLNRTPLFYDFLNGFTDFYTLFIVNGDYSLNFNFPGDSYYDALKRVFINNPTRTQIVSYYFQSQFANRLSYTLDEVRVAYYYPVLKEVLLDPQTKLIDYNLTYPGYTQDELIQYLIYSFQGLDDIIATSVINSNLTQLDLYRLLHTFRYSLVNRYVCLADATNNRVTIQSSALNTSLVNLLNYQYNLYFQQQLALYNLTEAQYNALSITTTNILSILQSMYDFMQFNFAVNFAVNFGTYSRSYYANPSNFVLLRDGLNASNIAYNYNNSNATLIPTETNILSNFRYNPPHYWNRMINLGSTIGAQVNMGATGVAFPTSSNFPYNIYNSNIDLTQNFVDASGFIYTDIRRRAGDILVNVEASKYTIFKFRSKYRQTLQVESLPRQTNWRYPLWNQNNPVPYPVDSLFDISYSFITPDSTLLNKISYPITFSPLYGWSNLAGTTSNFGINFTSSLTYWNGFFDTINPNNLKGNYYSFESPLPVPRTGPTDSNNYTYTLNVTIQSATGVFPTDLYAFFYHDLGAFYADVSGSRIESPINYKERLLISSGSSSNTYSFRSYQNQTYYILVRPVSENPASASYHVVPWFNNTEYSTLTYDTTFNPLQDPNMMLSNFNVAKNNDPSFIRLSIQSTLWGSNPTQDSVNNLVYADPPVIGYDVSGVSNDLTDYVPFNAFNSASTILPTTAIRADPINNYIFQFNSPYNTSSQSYFYSTSINALYTSNTSSIYTWKNNGKRQYKMLNWYATHYLYDTVNTGYDPLLDISQFILPYTKESTSNTFLNGYDYTGIDYKLALGSGVTGFTFLPSDGTWDMQQISFKTNFLTTNSTVNMNEKIQFLGVFYTSEILTDAISTINPANALAICMKKSSSTYSNVSSLNLGFDAGLGTYYTFSNVSSLVIRTGETISGYTQLTKTLLPNSNAYYSVLPFNGLNTTDVSNLQSTNPSIVSTAVSSIRGTLSSCSLAVIQHLTGSIVPYPFANQGYPSTTFYDGQMAPNARDMVLSTSNTNPVYGPKAGNDESIVQYEQSLPYVNSHLHFKTPYNIVIDASGFFTWSNSPAGTTNLLATVPNYMMFYDTNFYISQFSSIQRTFSTIEYTITADQVFPSYESTALLAVTGNSSNYVFLGASNDILRFKTFDPRSGSFGELPTNTNYTMTTSNFLFEKFVMNNNNAWFLTAKKPSSGELYLFGDTQYASTTNTMLTYAYAGYSNSVLQMDPSGSYIHFAKMTTITSGFQSYSRFSFDSGDANSYIRTTSTGIQINLENSQPLVLPTTYQDFAVTLNGGIDEVLLLNQTEYPYKYFKILLYTSNTATSSNTQIQQSEQLFRDASNNNISPTGIYGGARGSKWVSFGTTPFVMGNRNNDFDAPTTLDMAWQIFFPTIKIEMLKLTNGYTPITDLTNLTYPEYPHVMMFGYSNFTTLSNDILSTGGKWGLENNSNFYVSDVSFNGFYFNSYLMNFPLKPNSDCNASNPEYYNYLAIRGYSPTESFQTMLRFYLPNRYDFGFISLRDLSSEVILAQTNPDEFNPSYKNALSSFNSSFTFTNRTFGSNAASGFLGSNFTSQNFGDFLRQYTNIYNLFVTNSVTLSNIQGALQSNINNFITNDLKYILPNSALTRQRYTDPLLFQILWRSNLKPNFLILDDEWGLGWNLGFPKEDTTFKTVHTGNTFYKIQQDFIYLRLNQEFNINKMDAGGKENYRSSREATGTTNQYYCKLLLTNFGGNATTFIHNPITFNPPLAKLNKLQFQWLYPNGQIIDNIDAEWNCTVNVEERMEIPQIPDKMFFLPANPRTGKPAELPKGFQEAKLQEQGERQAERDIQAQEVEKENLRREMLKLNQQTLRNRNK